MAFLLHVDTDESQDNKVVLIVLKKRETRSRRVRRIHVYGDGGCWLMFVPE